MKLVILNPDAEPNEVDDFVTDLLGHKEAPPDDDGAPDEDQKE